MGIYDNPIQYHFYCDASSHRESDFMVCGGIIFRKARLAEIEATIKGHREKAGISEMGWSDYRGGARKEAYHAVASLLFELVRTKQATFFVLIAPFKGYVHKPSKKKQDNMTSVNRLYFQLLLHRVVPRIGKHHEIFVFPDKGNDSRDLVRFRHSLCKLAMKRKGARFNSVPYIQALDSHQCEPIQMVDIVIGAIAAVRNNRALAPHKAELAAHILKESGRYSWVGSTMWNHMGVNVWDFKPRVRKPRRP